MSASIMPDMYRHTARKSTVSKNLKTSSISLCNNNNSTTHYANHHNDTNNSKQTTTIFDSIECNIKLEKEIPQTQESFLILPDNEIEQMIIGDNIEQTNEDIIHDIIEQIKNHIVQSPSNIDIANTNQIQRNFSIDTQDVHNTVDSIMNQFNENDNEESLSISIDNKTKETKSNRNSTSMSSRSHIDDDIVEIQESSSINDTSSSSCTCQCHKPTSPINNEYLLFERALKQTRLEQQQERSLNNNRLLQTLKRQHDELMNVYQQNKTQKILNPNKVDREQQTNNSHLQDSQMQTDLTTINHSKILTKQEQKPLTVPTMNSTNNGTLSATRNYTGIFNSLQSSQQITPRLATTTVTSKTSTVTTKTAIVTNTLSTTSIPPPSSTASSSSSHDVVDLTEEDEDDNTTRISTQRTAPSRQSTSSIHPSTLSSSTASASATATTTPAAAAAAAAPSTTTATATAPTAATRIRPPVRNIRPNNPVPNGQVFPLRPLPEHVPCDHTIARPQLSITQENATVRLTWNLQSTPMESIQNYEIYAYKQNATVTTSDWKKIGTVKSMRLPMAVTLKEFQSNSHYAFAVRAVSINNNIGPFCEPKTIFTGNTPVQPLHTSQLLNVST